MHELTDSPTEAPPRVPYQPLRIGETLVAAGAVTDVQIETALVQKQPNERLGDTVVRLGMCSEADVANAVATKLGLPRVDVLVATPQPEALALISAELAEDLNLLPLRYELGVLTVASADPDLGRLDDLRLLTDAHHVRAEITTVSALRLARRRAYRSRLALQDVSTNADEEPRGDEFDDADADNPVVQFIDNLLADALLGRASDLHFEPDFEGLRVRMRVDGLLRDVTRVAPDLRLRVISRLKILAQLDIAEKRLPQDGRAFVRTEVGDIDLRVASMPTMFGEKIVLRLLSRGADRITIGQLGFSPGVRDSLVDALQQPQGLVLVTGPTGSGKTTTLYAGLAAITDETRNVVTLEDPIEYELPGVNQTQVDPRIGFTFAKGLRHLLRQDPDVVLVGEIRDQETAQLAVEAATTGHLVLATLHTNDAPSSLARLIDLGADRFLVRSSLLLVVAQRLARTVCSGCAVPDTEYEKVLPRLGITPDRLAGASPRRGAGCATCEFTGEFGRTSLAEALPITAELRQLLGSAPTEQEIFTLAREEGMRTLREDGLLRAWAGDISFAEVLRTTPAPGQSRPALVATSA